jgi:hypothetical protein
MHNDPSHIDLDGYLRFPAGFEAPPPASLRARRGGRNPVLPAGGANIDIDGLEQPGGDNR